MSVVDDFAFVQHDVVDVVDLVQRNRLNVTREDRTAMRVDRRQHKLGQISRYASERSVSHAPLYTADYRVSNPDSPSPKTRVTRTSASSENPDSPLSEIRGSELKN